MLLTGHFARMKEVMSLARLVTKAYFIPLFYSSLCSYRMAFTPTLALGVIIVRLHQDSDATTLILIVI
jgi:hypothetical protein